MFARRLYVQTYAATAADMNNRSRIVALSGLLTALTVVFLYLGNLIPPGRTSIIVIASLFTTAAIIESGLTAGAFVFAGSTIISALILPDKTIVLLYALFFGYYPLIKSLAERMRSKFLKWAVKILVFNVGFTVIWFLFKSLVFNATYMELQVFIVYPVANIVFILYDLAMTKLISIYIVRLSKFIKKNKSNR